MQSDVIEKYRCLANEGADNHTYSLSKEEWEEFQRITQKCKEYGRTVEEYLDAVEDFQKIMSNGKEELFELSKYRDTTIDLDVESATEILVRTMEEYEINHSVNYSSLEQKEIQKKYLGGVEEVQSKGYENCVTSNDIKTLREQTERADEVEYSGNDMCQLSQEQLERYGEESFRKYQEMLNEEISDEDYQKIDEQFNNIKESYNSKSPFSFRDDVAYFFLVTLPRKFKKNNI